MADPVAGERRSPTATERLGLAAAISVLLAVSAPELWHQALWLDEAYTAAAVEHLGVSLSRTRGTMPLYYVTMWVWGQVSIAPWWLRLPSLGASVVVLSVTQAIARRFLRPVAVTLVPLVLVCVPMFQVKALEARPYALWTLLVVASFWCVLRAGDERSSSASGRRLLACLTAIGIIGPLVHGLFICQLIAVVVFALGYRGRIRPRSLLPAVVGCSLVTLVLTAVAGEDAAGASASGGIPGLLANSFLGTSVPPAVILGLFGLIGLAHLAGRICGGESIAWLPVVWVAIPLVLLLGLTVLRGLFYPRYIVACAPGLALVVAAGTGVVVGRLTELVVDRNRSRTRRASALALTVAVGIASALQGPVRPQGEVLEDWDEAAAFVASGAHSGDGILFDYWNSDSWIYRMQFRVPFEVAWSTIDDRPSLTAVSPPRPLGAARRVDEVPDTTETLARTLNFERVWVVAYRGSWSEGVVTSRGFRRSFVEVASEAFPTQIRVALYERRPR